MIDADTLTMLCREGDVEANDEFQRQFSPSCNFQKSFENSMILPAALSGRFLFLMGWCGERCSLSLCFSRGPWLVGIVFGPLLDMWNLFLCFFYDWYSDNQNHWLKS